MYAVRLFKTRTAAALACERSKISVDGKTLKASNLVKVDDIVEIKTGPIVRKMKILQLAGKRMGAKLVSDYVKEVTSEDELLRLQIFLRQRSGLRPGTKGRPTKKERRQLDDFTYFFDHED